MDEIGIPFERIDKGGQYGGLDDAQYRVLNPNGLVPTLVDGDTVIWESNAILRYLAREYGPHLVPPTAARAAIADTWMDWQLTVLWPAIRPLFLQLVRTPVERRDSDLIKSHADQTIRALNILEDRLSTAGSDFMCGPDLTVADVPIGVSVHRWFALPVEQVELPRVTEWYDRLKRRLAFSRNVIIPLT